MTNPAPHWQVPEALIDLIDAYAETRHRCGGIYNARTEAARKAVIEALSGVQALSAAPAAAAGPSLQHLHDLLYTAQRTTGDAQAQAIAEARIALSGIMTAQEPAVLASRAWPKVSGVSRDEGHSRALLVFFAAESTDDEMRAVHDTLAAAPTAKAATQQEAQEPVAWQGVHDQTDLYYTKPLQADVRPLYAAPQPAPAPMGDEVLKEVIKDSNRYRWLRRPLLNAGQGSIQVVMDDRLNGKIDRVIFLDELDKAIDAALAAQGGSK